MLQVAGWLQAQSIHNVAQILCGAQRGGLNSNVFTQSGTAGFASKQKLNKILRHCTNICDQLFCGMRGKLRDEQNGIAVRLHGCSSDGAQPVVCCVVQLRKVIAWNNKGTSLCSVIAGEQVK